MKPFTNDDLKELKSILNFIGETLLIKGPSDKNKRAFNLLSLIARLEAAEDIVAIACHPSFCKVNLLPAINRWAKKCGKKK